MDRLSNNYYNHLIFDNEFYYKDKIIYFEILIKEAYTYNPNFKKFDKKTVKNNLNTIIKEMRKKFFESSPEKIISIISTLRLWNRNNLPASFIFNSRDA